MMKPFVALISMSLLAIAGCQSAGLDKGGSESIFGYASGESNIAKSRKIEAQTQFRAENYDAAFDIFNEVLQVSPGDSDAWLGYAAAADRLERFDAADSAYAKLSKLKPGDPTVLNNFGYSQLLRGNVKKAYAYLSQAQKLAPANQRIVNNVQLIRAGSKSKAK